MGTPSHRYGLVDVSVEDRVYRVRMATTIEQLDDMLKQPKDSNPLQKTVLKAIEVRRRQLMRREQEENHHGRY